MERGRLKARLVVAPSGRQALERWTRRRRTAQALALRTRITLLCAKGLSNTSVAESLHASQQMVCKWRRRFMERRLDGLLDEARPGAPRRVGDEEVERVIVRTLESTPADATHWSVRSMAKVTRSTCWARTAPFGITWYRPPISRARFQFGCACSPDFHSDSATSLEGNCGLRFKSDSQSQRH